MKLSIAWIFDHIDTPLTGVDIPALITQFGQTTAEIETFYKITVDLADITIAKVTHIQEKSVTVFSAEHNKSFELPARTDAPSDALFLINTIDKPSWVTAQQVGSHRDGLVPQLYCSPEEEKGAWKQKFETTDYIFEIDNKAINHRPDLWGHAGIAREMAAIVKKPLKPLSSMLKEVAVEQSAEHAHASAQNPYAVIIQPNSGCKRIATVYVESITNRPSSIPMMHRLLRVDAKPIDFIVDTTNYVMLDVGQPMHAFDAQALNQQLVVTKASAKEKLELLDDTTIELTADDIVITNGSNAASLAGIMGGKSSSITPYTQSMILESGCFDATTVRKSAAHHKKRTEASSRFEKTLDPNQTVIALERMLFILAQSGIPFKSTAPIVSVGTVAHENQVTVAHSIIDRILGTHVAADKIKNILSPLGFAVVHKSENSEFKITAPTWRAKDIHIPQDIAEEVGRYIGYSTLERTLPKRFMAPFSIHAITTERAIKNHLAYGLHMHEVRQYAFFDESYLLKLQWSPKQTLTVRNGVSENWQRLVTSIIPQLCKAVEDNPNYDHLRFFEWATTWQLSATRHNEQKVLAGIIFDRKQPVDFYVGKQQLQTLFDELKFVVEWVQVTNSSQPWYMPYQSAQLMNDGKVIGTAGKIHPAWAAKIGAGEGFIFELYAQQLVEYHSPIKQLRMPSKYPAIDRDISMMVAASVTVEKVNSIITTADSRITKVLLRDFFQKPEWKDEKSLTFRFIIQDEAKTLTKPEADAIWETVRTKLQAFGATIR